MKTKLLAILFVSLLGGCDRCEEEPLTELEKLPPATQEGKNTFGCLVNGKAWVTKTSIDARSFYQSGVLSVSAKVINENFYQGISLNVLDQNIFATEYELGDPPKSFAQLGDLRTSCGYETSSQYLGKLVVVKFDPINYIISGAFEFEASSVDCGSTVKVTNGRFDLNYAP